MLYRFTLLQCKMTSRETLNSPLAKRLVRNQSLPLMFRSAGNNWSICRLEENVCHALAMSSLKSCLYMWVLDVVRPSSRFISKHQSTLRTPNPEHKNSGYLSISSILRSPTIDECWPSHNFDCRSTLNRHLPTRVLYTGSIVQSRIPPLARSAFLRRHHRHTLIILLWASHTAPPLEIVPVHEVYGRHINGFRPAYKSPRGENKTSTLSYTRFRPTPLRGGQGEATSNHWSSELVVSLVGASYRWKKYSHSYMAPGLARHAKHTRSDTNTTLH